MRVFCLGIIAFCTAVGVFSHEGGSAIEGYQKRIRDHLLIKDYTSALSDLKLFLARFPQSKELHILKVCALAESGSGLEALEAWNGLIASYPEVKENVHLIETVAWGILSRAESSSQQVVNISSMIGASLTRDAKAVQVLQRHLRSSNAYLRMVAVRLATQYGDRQLIEEIQRMLKKEVVWYVRLEILRALGRLQCKEVTSLLKEIVESPKSTIEERATAAEALLSLYDHLEGKELQKLLESPRAGLRYLACNIVAYLNLQDQAESIASLMQDTSTEVKIAALNTLTVIGLPSSCKISILEKVKVLLEEEHPVVAITACRLLMHYQSHEALTCLKKWITGDQAEMARLAACALALSGSFGKEAARQLLSKVKDDFIKVNLAYGSLSQEGPVGELCEEIALFLAKQEGKIMLDMSWNPLLKVVAPSRIRHTPEMVQYPTVVDQHTRLHLLNVLAIMGYPQAEASIKNYLKSQSMGATYAASALLIEEGAEDSIEIIKDLLKDPEEKVRVQAALVLAMLGGDKEALQVLKEMYPKVDRDLKIAILEAMGHIGSKEEIPFLLGLLEDPFNVMKVIAASSIIQCIYH
ncbi:MAG: hypothetical protein FJZ63_07035 [Chlamydiae bacterium]|nr:hypothetical protein [Chlamydiota bacterium]